jgi:hypothetical protein
MRRLTRAIGVGALGLGLASCGQPDNSLQGSMNEVAPLTFTTTVVRANSNALVVEYQNFPKGGGNDVTFKMVIDIANLTLVKNLPIDLSERLQDGNYRATFSRAVGTDPRRNLPTVKLGELDLDSDIIVGAQARGHFHILFAEGGQVGEGRTVEGTFSAPTQDVLPGGAP